MKFDELKERIREDLKIIDGDKTMVQNMIRNSKHRPRPVAKDLKRSEIARGEGNKLYEQVVTHPASEYKILHLYNESVAFAPPKSTALATAYGNRSAVLRRMLKFKHSICEADKALAITESVPLKIKLLCRKAECFTALGSLENKKCLEEAQFLLRELEDSDKIKEMLSKLICRAQFFIDNPTLEYSKEEKIMDETVVQSTQIVEDAEKTTSIESSFKMKYSKKYGHYLVAARDFKPGEIMCVEKSYHALVMDCKTPSYCCQCLKFLWTIVPCDYCSWNMYCSEECKSEAWDQYHDIECFPSRCLKEVLPIDEFVDRSPSVIFFKALKEAGSMDQLQIQVKLLDQCEDHSNENLLTSTNFLSFKTLYLTPTRIVSEEEFNGCVRSASFCIIGYAKSVLKTTYDSYDLRKLMKNEEAIFMAALICKLGIINKGRVQQAQQFDPAGGGCTNAPTNNCILLSGMFAPISCVPNIMHCPTSNHKFLTYALEPIKAGTQLFSSIHLASIYYNATKAQRMMNHRHFYGGLCDCKACANDWLERLNSLSKLLPPIPDAKSDLWVEFNTELHRIKREMETSSLRKLSLVDARLIDRIRRLIVEAWEHFPMPSTLTFEAIKLMIDLFESFFPFNNRITFRWV